MAYPTINGPYGLKPVNLIGGQVFSGSTRSLPISYGYASNIFYGDLVTIGSGSTTTGTVTVTAVSTSLSTKGTIGVFLGCSYTNPATKQKLFSQYWPAGTLAGDAVAIVCDDPDTVFKIAVVASSSSNTISSLPSLMVGGNAYINTPVGNVNTGDSGLGLVTTGSSVGSAAMRVLGLVPDTQIVSSGTLVSGTGTSTFVVSGLTPGAFIPANTDVFQLVNGQLQQIGQYGYVSSSVTVPSTGNTTINIGSTPSVTVSNGATLVFVQTQEVLVKINFGYHTYYAA